MQVGQVVQAASQRIQRRDAEMLLVHLLGQNRAWLLAHPEALVAEAELDSYEALVARRERGEPFQYITESQEFLGMNLRVSPAVLIPRPETELLVEAAVAWALGQADRGCPIQRAVDVGTGSGAIALGLQRALPHAQIWAADLSTAALELARDNAIRVDAGNRIHFIQDDLLTAFLPGNVLASSAPLDMVVSNPPYVALREAATMQREVRDFEPHTALFAGEDGLAIYRRLIPQAAVVLRPGGLLALEFGFGQQPALEELLQGWSSVRFHADYSGIPRLALANHS